MSIFAAAAAVLAADPHLGVPATYTPAASVRVRWLGLDFAGDSYTTFTRGDPVEIRVVLSRPEDAIGGLDAPRAIAAAAVAMIPAAALPDRPVRGDAITIAGQAYRVEEVMQDEAAASYTLHLRRA